MTLHWWFLPSINIFKKVKTWGFEIWFHRKMSTEIKLEQNLFSISENCNKILKWRFLKVKRNKIQRLFCQNEEIPSNWHNQTFLQISQTGFQDVILWTNCFTKFESSAFTKNVTKLMKSTNRLHVKTLTFLVVHGSVNCYYAKSSVKSNLSENSQFTFAKSNHKQNK